MVTWTTDKSMTDFLIDVLRSEYGDVISSVYCPQDDTIFLLRQPGLPIEHVYFGPIVNALEPQMIIGHPDVLAKTGKEILDMIWHECTFIEMSTP